MGVSKIGKHPKMDGENNGKPIKMDDFGGRTPVFGNIHMETWPESLREVVGLE